MAMDLPKLGEDFFIDPDPENSVFGRLEFTVKAKQSDILSSKAVFDVLEKRAEEDYGFKRPAFEPQFTGSVKSAKGEEGLVQKKIVITDYTGF